MAEHANSTPAPEVQAPLISPVDRRHLEAVVERLGSYHDRYARHIRRASAALERIERLRQSAINALDVIDGDPDFEDGGDEEPSLSFTGNVNQDHAIRLEPTGAAHFTDLEDACEDEGGEHDGREPEGYC